MPLVTSTRRLRSQGLEPQPLSSQPPLPILLPEFSELLTLPELPKLPGVALSPPPPSPPVLVPIPRSPRKYKRYSLSLRVETLTL
jgi:hypothetical protein